MTPKLHYFNPGHETAVLDGSPHYTPIKAVQRMIKELAYLPAWYGDAEDYVYTEAAASPHFFSQLPNELHPFATIVTASDLMPCPPPLPPLEAAPWGVSPQSLRVMERIQQKGDLNLHIPIWNEAFTRLTGRQTASACLDEIRTQLPDLSLPAAPQFCSTLSEIEQFLALQKAPFVIKTPFSSSGRGLLWINTHTLPEKETEWISGAISKQGSVSIECGVDKKMDFAMEFYSDGQGKVHYEGLSLFKTEKNGAYSGNVLGSRTYTERFFQTHFPQTFVRIREAVGQALQKIYGGVYAGYLGVDMLVYQTNDQQLAIHPCIEINMRYTMGMVALRLSQKYLHPDATGEFYITFDTKAGEAYTQHGAMEKAYPTTFVEGKLRAGYLSLCPITPETSYRAYMLVV